LGISPFEETLYGSSRYLPDMADLLISRVSPGVSVARSVDHFDTLEILRINRSQWSETPKRPGVYLLYGQSPEGTLTVYVGMSTKDMRSRIKSHHVNGKKNWFGVLFAVPIDNPLLCRAVEAELIGQVGEANVVEVIANKATESAHKGIQDPQIEPTVEKVRDGLELLLGSDIFTPLEDEDEVTALDEPVKRLAPLAREYRGQASEPRAREIGDPAEATHAYIGAGQIAFGLFEGAEPDKAFRVLAGSQWRRPVLNPDAKTFGLQVKVDKLQRKLINEGILDPDGMVFLKEHVFENWNYATQVVSGKGQYSGAYHWQLLLE